MAAYIIIRIAITDTDKIKDYQAVVPGIVQQYGGRFLARGGAVVSLEGEKESRRVVIIEFPDMATAQAFYHSPEYSNAIQLREGAAIAQIIAVDGL